VANAVLNKRGRSKCSRTRQVLLRLILNGTIPTTHLLIGKL